MCVSKLLFTFHSCILIINISINAKENKKFQLNQKNALVSSKMKKKVDCFSVFAPMQFHLLTNKKGYYFKQKKYNVITRFDSLNIIIAHSLLVGIFILVRHWEVFDILWNCFSAQKKGFAPSRAAAFWC